MLVKNWPTLLRIGEMASERSQAEYLANSENQKSRTCGWLTLLSNTSRNLSSVKSRGRSNSVLPGFSNRVKSEFRKMCSSRGPQKSAQTFLRTEIMPEATKYRWSGETFSKGLKARGYSISAGLK